MCVCAWQVIAFNVEVGTRGACTNDYLEVNGEKYCGANTESGPVDVIPDGA